MKTDNLITKLIKFCYSLVTKDIIVNNYCEYQSRSLWACKYRQIRTYSLSNSILTRSGNSSYTIRNIGQNSKGKIKYEYHYMFICLSKNTRIKSTTKRYSYTMKLISLKI